jgi:hypothetical protein
MCAYVGKAYRRNMKGHGVEKPLDLRHLSGAYFADLLYNPVLPTE